MKQTSWLSGLAAVRRPKRTACARTSALVISPTGNEHPAQLGLAQHGQHVGLVLVGVGPAAQARARARAAVTRAWWPVARRSKPSRSARSQQPVELDGPVALDAGVGRPSPRVRLDVGRHHLPVELLGQVEDVVVDAQLLGHPAGVIDVGHRAAARVRRRRPTA